MSKSLPSDDEAPDSVGSSIIAMAQSSIDRVPPEQPEGSFDGDPAVDCESLDEFAAILARILSGFPPAVTGEQVQQSKTKDTSFADDRFPSHAHLGRFRLIRQLGHGGFGVVLLAFDPRLQREVALKLPRPELLALGKWRKQFFHEARSAAALDHPGIVPIFDIGNVGPVWYIASAYCNGPTLNEWRRERAPLSTRLAAELVAQIADAVQHAHSRGILHRDLKPANILLKLPPGAADSATPTALVTDFGLASRKPPRGKSQCGSGLAGTLAYMAPEQTFDNQAQVGIAVDVYALGAILFELLTDRLPFTAQVEKALIEQIRHEPAPTLRLIRPGAPRDLEAVCAKCLAKEPNERYESAADLARDLRRFLAGDCVEARPVGLPQRTWRWCKRRPAMAGLAAALLLAVVCGAAVSLRQWQRAEKNLQQAEAAVVNLGWAIDDAVFWHNDNDRYGPEQRLELTRRYAALLEQLRDQSAAKPVRAAADCFFARLDVLDGKPDKAREKFDRSISAWCELVHADRSDMFSRRALAKTLYCYGTFLVTDDNLADGMCHFDANRLFGHFDVADRVGQTVISDYSDILYEMAESLRERDFDFEAAQRYAACIEISRRLTAAKQGNASAQFRMLQCLVRLDAVHRPAASREGTYKTRTEVLTELRALVRDFPDRNDYRLEHASVAGWLATRAGRLGQGAQSDDLLAEALESLEFAVARHDFPPEAKRKYGDILRFKALRQLELDERAEAVQCASECLRWYDMAELAGAIEALPHAVGCRVVGGIYVDCGADSDAVAAFERASKLYESACGGATRNRSVHLQHADVWAKLSALYEKSGRNREAFEASHEAVRVLEAWRGPTPAEPHVALQLRRLRSNVSRLQSAQEETL